ncbi:hypothetical protein THAOC_15517 [Thalassiosira oceanica]|uniref:RING-type domain-containing protein n=1 Tax=Thalassiosira oceanica TaxID=159749 RepID=K0SCI7_THAOC|nr:hypothetical protein THAOC_15517 [Thalassiosira oceanica]|eukprot:EJK63808.1 hypothetical protein THAOC_15517 [Thalassiosira oceanica]
MDASNEGGGICLKMDGRNDSNECGICLGEWTNPVKLPCGHSFCADCLSGWKPKFGRLNDRQRKRCPLCRGSIPPSQEQISEIKMTMFLMNNTSVDDPNYGIYAREVGQFEAEYGEDWDGTTIEYGNDFVSIPDYVGKAVYQGDLRTVLQWLGKGNIKERANAKLEDGGNISLLLFAAMNQHHDLMSYLLLNGADVNALDSAGMSVLTLIGCRPGNLSRAVRLLLSWGAELFMDGKGMAGQDRKLACAEISEGGNAAIANLMSSELWGRRCEVISAPNTSNDLVSKTCVVDDYITESNQYKVKMEFTNEVLLLDSDNLKRRDRTPQDPGYYVECKNNRLIHRDFKSNEECQAFIASLCANGQEASEVDPDAEAKAEQAAADLLAELGLEDMESLGSSASKKEKHPVTTGRKKKRGGKRKGVKPV